MDALQTLNCSLDEFSFSRLRESLKVFNNEISVRSAVNQVEVHDGLHFQVLGQDLDGGLVVALL